MLTSQQRHINLKVKKSLRRNKQVLCWNNTITCGCYLFIIVIFFTYNRICFFLLLAVRFLLPESICAHQTVTVSTHDRRQGDYLSVQQVQILFLKCIALINSSQKIYFTTSQKTKLLMLRSNKHSNYLKHLKPLKKQWIYIFNFSP